MEGGVSEECCRGDVKEVANVRVESGCAREDGRVVCRVEHRMLRVQVKGTF